MGAYVHVPFCERICPFCPYNKVRAEEHLAQRYFAALHREIDWYVAERGVPFTSLYIGGGTPTLYPDELAEVIRQIPVSGERAVEVLPTHGTVERLDRLAEMGITAVSIGAQSFHDGVLHQLRRPHDAAASRAAVENALGRFALVDVDLIVDVAWEDRDAFPGAFIDDVRTCFALGVDQVSTYPLMRFGFTPFGTARHDRRREHAVLAQVTELAESMGYERRSVWTFNRRGAAPYTSITRRRFLGMGAGSTSYAGGDFYVNHFGVGSYADAIEHGRLPVARWLHLGRWGGAAYDAFWQAYSGGVDVEQLRQSYGQVVAAVARAGLAPLVLAGLLRRAAGGYRLTARGFDAYHDLERWVTYQLIEPLWAEMLTEHAALPCEETRARWVTPERARSGRAWSLARRLFER
nr:radical SAM protein [Microlunatus panaciterrae]